MKSTLSKSEFEIAERIVLGESKKEVAAHTHRSIYTVETTIKNIYEKLGFNKVQDLVLWYCGQVFGISYQISERRKQVFAICLLLLISLDIAFDNQDLFRARRTRTGRRRNETEQFES